MGTIVATALGFLPYVLTAVQAVESSITAAGSGATKKALVINAILAAAKVGEEVPNSTAALISALIDNTVSTLNSAGLFGHTAAAPAAPAAQTAAAGK